MKIRFLLQASLACLAGLAVSACSSTTVSPAENRGVDGVLPSDACAPAVPVPADAGPGAGRPVNGCTAADFAANDRTAEGAERVILAPDGPAPAQFTPHCMRVRIGQTVTWKGDLESHPISYKLVATSRGGFGDAGSTFVVGDADGGATQNTAETGEPMTISFTCDKHPTIMFGAVDVVP